jgi:hypothetical protein
MFWGAKDSSSYFCEKPYGNSHYIAEYYNTISAIPYILVGIYIYNVLKYSKIGISVVLIGLGTMLLHGTQRYYGQWADEMSMIFFCFSVIQKLNKRINNYFLGVIYGIYYIFNENWFCFICLFLVLVRYLFYLMKYKKKYKYKKIYTNRTIIIFKVSVLLWLIDQLACLTVGNVYLHSCWHIGTAFAILHGVIYL